MAGAHALGRQGGRMNSKAYFSHIHTTVQSSIIRLMINGIVLVVWPLPSYISVDVLVHRLQCLCNQLDDTGFDSAQNDDLRFSLACLTSAKLLARPNWKVRSKAWAPSHLFAIQSRSNEEVMSSYLHDMRVLSPLIPGFANRFSLFSSHKISFGHNDAAKLISLLYPTEPSTLTYATLMVLSDRIMYSGTARTPFFAHVQLPPRSKSGSCGT